MDFDLVVSELTERAHQNVAQRLEFLRNRCPAIVAQIHRDREPDGPFAYWGQSLNTDEIADHTIVERPILETLAKAANLKMSLTYPHAGVQHTYGYLFSSIQTPYGKKRERWIDGSLERAFRQPAETFGPFPQEGTLLANATWLAGHFAFRKDTFITRLHVRLRARIAESLLEIQWDRYRSQRFTESTQFLDGATLVTIVLQSDIIFIGHQGNQGPNPYLLVYSTQDSRKSHPELITLFTVSESFVEAIHTRAKQRKIADVRPRYNTYIPGFPATPQFGTCQLEEP